MPSLSLVRSSGKHFGNLYKVYGEYKFSLAPSEQKVFHNWGRHLVNTFKQNIGRNWYFYAPPATVLYLLYDWAIKENYRISRKDPKQYENDV